MGDILFKTIEKFHGAKAWGRILDAGTGVHSIKWIQTLPSSGWTAITADNNMRNQMMRESGVATSMRQQDSVIVGNWMDSSFCENLGTFDTILADYLIGAVDGFSPYQQDEIIVKLKRHLTPEGRLYIIGMNPIPDDPAPPAEIVSEIRRARDACILLAGQRPYREFPLDWMRRHLVSAQFSLLGTKNFTILHSEDSAVRQIQVGRSKLGLMKSSDIRLGMENYLNDLESRTRQAVRAAGGKIPLSFDYVISAEHTEHHLALLAQQPHAEGSACEGHDHGHGHGHEHHDGVSAEDAEHQHSMSVVSSPGASSVADGSAASVFSFVK